MQSGSSDGAPNLTVSCIPPKERETEVKREREREIEVAVTTVCPFEIETEIETDGGVESEFASNIREAVVLRAGKELGMETGKQIGMKTNEEMATNTPTIIKSLDLSIPETQTTNGPSKVI